MTYCLAAHRSQDIRVPQATNIEGASSAGGSAAGLSSVVNGQRNSNHQTPAVVTSNIKEAASHSSCPALVPFIRRPQECSDCDKDLANIEG